MPSISRTTMIAVLVPFLAAVPARAATGPVTDAERERLRTRIELALGPAEIAAAGERIHCEATLRRFYLDRLYEPAWTDDFGPTALADSLVAAIAAADREGLTPADYHLEPITAYLAAARAAAAPDPGRLTDLELLLTDAFLLYGSHCLSGRLDPETIDPEWLAARRQADLAQVLARALEAGDPGTALRGLLPPQPGYAALREALAAHRALAAAGGWPAVAEGPALKPGDRGPRVAALRTRLAATGEFSADDAGTGAPDPEFFGVDLGDAVRTFQADHGLEPDGVVGPATLRELTATAAERAEQIAVNLERWRWLPQDLGGAYLLVNIADFRLDVVEDGRTVLETEVIVGRPYRRTPVFTGGMTYLVFSPAWEVPHKLAVQDILPQIREDRGVLERKRFVVLQGWGADERIVDPDTVPWDELSAKNFPYRLRQQPGPENALGGVKFMFPNKFNVYLHDTPNRELFAKAVRTFSSGCIRVRDPERLAAWLLAGSPQWTSETIGQAMGLGRERTVRLPRSVPVHLLYWTAWVARDGAVRFRPDIYGRDAAVAAALREAPPPPAAR